MMTVRTIYMIQHILNLSSSWKLVLNLNLYEEENGSRWDIWYLLQGFVNLLDNVFSFSLHIF